ncbi:NADPH oxidase 3 [Coemansia sp. RSA 2424]|nr:NADPH oxidase 3 [Coemansia sp. RSA 2424]
MDSATNTQLLTAPDWHASNAEMKLRSSSLSSGRLLHSAETASLEPRIGGWHRLSDAEWLSELTVGKGTAVLAWIIPHVIICAYKLAQHRGSLSVRIDEVAMSCILLDIAAVLTFMSPAFLMLLRRTFLPRFVSLEKNVHAHTVASYTLLFWTAVHIGIHYNNYVLQARPHESSTSAPVPGVSLRLKLFGTRTGWTGHAMASALVVIMITSIKLIRRRFFEVFYYVHQLFIIHIVLLFVHNQNRLVYKYLSGPIALYCADRLYRNLRTVFAKSPIRAIIQHPLGVVEIQLDKRIIGHRPGQYVKLYCPSVSLIQWHPITISSAPEEELLTLHFRVAGGWTSSFADRLGCSFGTNARSSTSQKLVATSTELGVPPFGRRCHSAAPKDIATAPPLDTPYHPLHLDSATAPILSRINGDSPYVDIDMTAKGDKDVVYEPATIAEMPTLTQMESGNVVVKMGAELPVVFIDGPYSVPAEHFFEYEVSVLIAAGIGVTPIAAVLRSVYFKWLQDRDQLPCKKVYVFWVFRDIGAIGWFKDLLIALEEGLSPIVELRTYFTGDMSELCAQPLTSAEDRFGKKARNMSTGTQLYIGRPDFGNIFEYLGEQHPDIRVGTFICGPKPMIRMVRRETRKWDTRLRRLSNASVDFYSEHF